MYNSCIDFSLPNSAWFCQYRAKSVYACWICLTQGNLYYCFTALADIMKRLLTKYDNLFETSFPYSMGWHGKYKN